MQLRNMLTIAAAVAVAVAAAPTRADEADQTRALMAKLAPSVVTIDVVLTTQMAQGGAGQSQEMRAAFEGVVVSPDGLVMLSTLPWSPKSLSSMFGAHDSDDNGMKITPKDFKVIIDKEDKEYSASLAATDATLGLGFLKIQGLGDRKLAAVNFTATSTPAVGQKVLGISRLAKGFDYAPYFHCAAITGEIGKPRKAYVLDSYLEIGLPAFSMQGEALGVLTMIAPGARDEGDTAAMFGAYMRAALGGGMGQSFLVPNSAVAAVIAQAKARAAELASHPEARPAAAPATAGGAPKSATAK